MATTMARHSLQPAEEAFRPPADILGATDRQVPLWRPRYVRPVPFLVHVPFAFWLVAALRPRAIVTLGVGEGVAHFAFCQAVDKLDLPARCSGFGRWETASGKPAQQVPSALQDWNERNYRDFATLELAAPGVVLGGLAADPVDLLCIDLADPVPQPGILDLEWPASLSGRGVVLIHAPRAMEGTEAGRERLRDIRGAYPSILFEAGEGLLVVLTGADLPDDLRRFTASGAGSPRTIRDRQMFRRLGQALASDADFATARQDARALGKAFDDLKADFAALDAAYEARNQRLALLEAQAFDRDHALRQAEAGLAERDGEIARLGERIEALDRGRMEDIGTIAVRDRALNRATAALQAAEERARGLAGALETRFDEIRTLTELLGERDGEIARLEDRVEALDRGRMEDVGTIAALRARVRKGRTAIEALRRQLADARRAGDAEGRNWRRYAAALERRHALHLEATTWRLMEPVRRTLRFLRRQNPPPSFRPRLTGGSGGSAVPKRRPPPAPEARDRDGRS